MSMEGPTFGKNKKEDDDLDFTAQLAEQKKAEERNVVDLNEKRRLKDEDIADMDNATTRRFDAVDRRNEDRKKAA